MLLLLLWNGTNFFSASDIFGVTVSAMCKDKKKTNAIVSTIHRSLILRTMKDSTSFLTFC